MKQQFGEEEPLKTIINQNEEIENGYNKDLSNTLYYYTKVREGIQLQSVNTKKIGPDARSSPWEIYHDFREYTVADRVVEALLEKRKIWNRIKDPWNYNSIDFSFVGTDIAITPKYMSSLQEIDNKGNPEKTYNVRMKEIFEGNHEQRETIIGLYENKLKDIRNLKINEETMEKYQGMATVNRLLLEQSRVGNRITQITRWAGDKAMLYLTVRSYADRYPGNTEKWGINVSNRSRADFIVPLTFEIDIEDIKNTIINDNSNIDNEGIEELIKDRIDNELKERISEKQNSYWVVKPVSGSRGTGMHFASTTEVLKNFLLWATSTYKVKNKNIGYAKWLISEFKKSFLWKLENPRKGITGSEREPPESLKLCEYQHKGEKGMIHEGTRPPLPKNFDGERTGLWDEAPILKVFEKDGESNRRKKWKDKETGKVFSYIKTCNPSEMEKANTDEKINQNKTYEQFRKHRFDDKKGRINKARVWFALDLSNGKYTIHVYHKLLFELCSKEFEGNDRYTDKQKVWTDVSEQRYGSSDKKEREESDYHLDGVNASRASELDLCYTVDWETGTWYKSTQDAKKGKKTNFPIGKWNEVKKNFEIFFEIFRNATKDNIHCLSEGEENFSKGCFQYFGMDFIVDDEGKVWLLELNTRPWVGYGNWWQKNFDPYNIHIPHKWHFLESMLRKFLDSKFDKQPSSLPYRVGKTDYIPDKCWIEIKVKEYEEKYVELEKPIAIMGKSIPIKKMANWIMNREIRNTIRTRGWGTFPYSKLIKNPALILQGMTPYINHLIKEAGEKNDFTTGEFQERIISMYPDLDRANVINRIFPLVYYLGNKLVMVKKLKDAYTDKQQAIAFTEGTSIDNPLPYYEIVPPTFFVDKSNNEWVGQLMEEIQEYESSRNIQKWIAKPALGKQGTGIFITDGNASEDREDLSEMIRHIFNDEDNKDEKNWVVSLYIDNPLLFNRRKTHTRVFVLVHNNNNNIGVYLMNKHLLFLAGLPYKNDEATDFYNFYFTEKAKKIIRRSSEEKGYGNGTNGFLKILDKFRNLTNLAKGKEMFLSYVKRPKKGENINCRFDDGKECTMVEQDLGKYGTWFKNGKLNENFGYKVLSYNAETIFDSVFEKGKYRKDIVPKIEKLVKQTVFAIKDDINCVNDYSIKGNGCYHYLAFDIMLDEKQHPWLLEVNVNPGLQAIKNILKKEGGGIGRFMNNIFDYTLNDKKTLKIVKINGKEYYVPRKFRDMSIEELKQNTGKLMRKYPNLFEEILTLDNSKNKKSMQMIGTTLFARSMRWNKQKAEPNKDDKDDKVEVKNTIDKGLMEWMDRYMDQAGWFGLEKNGGKMWVPPKMAFVLALAKNFMKDDDEPTNDNDNGKLEKYFQKIMELGMYHNVFGRGRMSLPWTFSTTGLQARNAAFNQILKPFRGFSKGMFGGRGMMNNFMNMYYYSQIFDMKDKDNNLIQLLFLGPENMLAMNMMKKFFSNDEKSQSKFGRSRFGEEYYIQTINGPVRFQDAFVALADMGSPAAYPLHSSTGYGRNTFWSQWYGHDDYGIPQLPGLPPGFEGCLDLEGSGQRGQKGMCIDPENHPWMCTKDDLSRMMKKAGIPKVLVNKAYNKSKDALICLMGTYGFSGLLGLEWPFANGHPSNNSAMMYMIQLMMQAGIKGNPFDYWKAYWKEIMDATSYERMMAMLNSGVGMNFYDINLPGGGVWTPGLEGMVGMNMMKKMLS